MAAYAALVSLMNTIHHIQNHTLYSFSFDHNQITSLAKNSQFFLDFVESYNDFLGRSQEMEDLEIQIASVAYLAENVLESLAADQILARSTPHHGEGQRQKSSRFLHNLQKKVKEILGMSQLVVDLKSVVNRMDSIVGKVMKAKEESRVQEKQSLDSKAVDASSRLVTKGVTKMVGFESYLLQLMEVLTGHQSSREIISVVGMGGIGKSTLARNAYENFGIERHFNVRAWVTISQEYDINEIMLQLLGRKGESTSDGLGEQLNKKLWGRRYLIILDDMWSVDVWDRIKFYFPDNRNGSRIVITTRISNVSTYLSSSSSLMIKMDLLDEDESWKLFCATTFGEEECPRDLVEIGKNIVKQCRGLPLSIVVIGGHLKKSLRMKEQWETVARYMIVLLDSGEEQCLSILSLSYTHLTARLKPCFLYMGVFREDEEIDVPDLIRLWVAEGFLQPDGGRSFEEIAESYIMELIDRNLVLVQHQGQRKGKILKCKVHDLVRETCLKESKKTRFFCVLKRRTAWRCKGGCLICSAQEIDKSRLLKIIPKFRPYSLEAFFDDHNINWRYVAGNLRGIHLPHAHLPSSISLYWNLQTLFIYRPSETILAPSEIWEMPWLRHVHVFRSIHLPDPPSKCFVMQSLHNLSVVENLMPSEEVFRRIPNIKELEIYYSHEASLSSSSSLKYCQHNLDHLDNLESLKLSFSAESNWRDFVLKLTYPSTLQELSLIGEIGIYWEDLGMIGLLPNLEVFTLGYANSVKGEEWSPTEGEFLSLKSLTIYNCDDLVCWNAESCHFPVLETLYLGYTYKLMEFPWEIGEIPTLRRVSLFMCGESAAISAIRILVEQEDLGNHDLQLKVWFWNDEEIQKVKEMVQEEDIESNNLFLSRT